MASLLAIYMGIEGQNPTLKKEGFMISRDAISVLKLF